MTTSPEAPIPGPLNNPDWSEEENREYDHIDHGMGLPAEKARRVLGLEDTEGPDEEPKAPAARKSLAQLSKNTRARNTRTAGRRPGFGVRADIADSDARVRATYDEQ